MRDAAPARATTTATERQEAPQLSGAAPANGGQESALSKIAELRGNAEYMAAYMAGDREKVAELMQLYEAAYPQGKAVADADAEHFGPPSDPGAYNLRLDLEDRDRAAGLQEEMRSALHGAGVPTSTVEAVRMVLERAEVLDDAGQQRSRLDGLAELERRHGAAAARQMIGDAKKLYDSVAARSPAIAEMLEVSGAANSPYLIENLARVVRATRR